MAFSKKAAGYRSIRGIQVGGGGPAKATPFLACPICGAVKLPDHRDPVWGLMYGGCVNGHSPEEIYKVLADAPQGAIALVINPH